MKRVRVLIVDDSPGMRALLAEMLGADPDIDVVGTAADALAARDRIRELDPDVVTLDTEMPDMDGLRFLSNLMRLRPRPVVMISTTSHAGAETTMRALALGAVDYANRPRVGQGFSIEDCAVEIVSKVKAAATAPVTHLAHSASTRRVRRAPGASRVPSESAPAAGFVIAIGASTGATEAIKAVLLGLPADAPAVVIAQHIPSGFRSSFAERMNRCTRLSVFEADDGMLLRTGHAYVAPGDKHLEIVRADGRLACRLDDGPEVNRHRPSVDILFGSVAESAGPDAAGIILTGMGRDGAAGLRRMRDSGAFTIAQDEESSIVWGMPHAAIEAGAVDEILSPDEIAARLSRRDRRRNAG